jgi:hypothetical protein
MRACNAPPQYNCALPVATASNTRSAPSSMGKSASAANNGGPRRLRFHRQLVRRAVWHRNVGRRIERISCDASRMPAGRARGVHGRVLRDRGRGRGRGHAPWNRPRAPAAPRTAPSHRTRGHPARALPRARRAATGARARRQGCRRGAPYGAPQRICGQGGRGTRVWPIRRLGDARGLQRREA